MWLALLSLIVSGFVSATLLPGTSEAVLLAFLWLYPRQWGLALMLVGIANTVGSFTSYLLTRYIPHKNENTNNKVLSAVRRYGTPLLFFSFVPVIGDALPLAAGWLRLPLLPCILFIGLGKFVRYGFIVGGWWLLKSAQMG